MHGKVIGRSQILLALSTEPAQLREEDVCVLERCTILLYDKTISSVDTDKARQEIFAKEIA